MEEERAFISFRGMEVIPEWPQRLRKAQRQTWLTIDGVRYQRVRYGDETEAEVSQPCGDCAAVAGEFHVLTCDMEECPRCGGQLIGCCLRLAQEGV